MVWGQAPLRRGSGGAARGHAANDPSWVIPTASYVIALQTV
jgi:hypothetical protein